MDSQPVRTRREHDVREPGQERLSRSPVRLDEVSQTQQGLDSLPLVPRCDPRIQTATGLWHRGTVHRLLRENSSPTQKPVATAAHSLDRGILVLSQGDLHRLDIRLESLRTGRQCQSQLAIRWRRPVGSEVPSLRAASNQCGAADIVWVTPKPRPALASFHQSCGHRVGQRVRDLLYNIVNGCESNRTVGARCPERFPSSVQRVESARSVLIEVAHELGQAGAGVGEHEMVVIREEAVGMEFDPVECSCSRQAIEKDVVCARRRPEQELALRAATRDEVGRTGENLSGVGHAEGNSTLRADVATVRVREVEDVRIQLEAADPHADSDSAGQYARWRTGNVPDRRRGPRGEKGPGLVRGGASQRPRRMNLGRVRAMNLGRVRSGSGPVAPRPR